MWTEEPKYYSTVQAARILGVSPDTVRNWCVAGKIEAVRMPGGTQSLWRIPCHLDIFHPERKKPEEEPVKKRPLEGQALLNHLIERHNMLRQRK